MCIVHGLSAWHAAQIVWSWLNLRVSFLLGCQRSNLYCAATMSSQALLCTSLLLFWRLSPAISPCLSRIHLWQFYRQPRTQLSHDAYAPLAHCIIYGSLCPAQLVSCAVKGKRQRRKHWAALHALHLIALHTLEKRHALARRPLPHRASNTLNAISPRSPHGAHNGRMAESLANRHA